MTATQKRCDIICADAQASTWATRAGKLWWAVGGGYTCPLEARGSTPPSSTPSKWPPASLTSFSTLGVSRRGMSHPGGLPTPLTTSFRLMAECVRHHRSARDAARHGSGGAGTHVRAG